MRFGKYILGILLVCSIALNVYEIARIRDLTQEVSEFGMRNQILEDYLRSETSNLRAAIDRVRTESRWMSSIDVMLGERSGDSQVVTLTWSLKESVTDSDVTLFLRSPTETDFVAHKAESLGDGKFKVDLQYGMPVKPTVGIVLHKQLQRGVSTSHSPNAAVEPGYGFQHAGLSYDCYVTMTDGNTIRRSEWVSVSFKEVAENVVSPLSVRINAKESGTNGPRFEVSVHERPADDFLVDPIYALEGVSLVGFLEGEKVWETHFTAEETIEIESRGQSKEVPFFAATVQEIPESADQMFLVFEFEGGRFASAFVGHYFRDY